MVKIQLIRDNFDGYDVSDAYSEYCGDPDFPVQIRHYGNVLGKVEMIAPQKEDQNLFGYASFGSNESEYIREYIEKEQYDVCHDRDTRAITGIRLREKNDNC